MVRHVAATQPTAVWSTGRQPYGPRATPGRFRTRVLTDGVTPSLHIDYKHTRIKQYHKEGRALRTETTIVKPLESWRRSYATSALTCAVDADRACAI
jgi:hypothetical protein